MRIKILLGSIIVFLILVFVSYTSVVGHQDMESDYKIVSPLFYIRSNRINKNEEKDIQCNYIGKNKDVGFLFFDRNEDKLLVQNLIERINEMDDSDIENLLHMVNMKFPKNKYFDKEKMTALFHELNSDQNKFYELSSHVNFFKKSDPPIAYTIGEPWYLGCFLEFISVVLISIIIGIAGFFWLLMIITHPTVYTWTCDPCPT